MSWSEAAGGSRTSQAHGGQVGGAGASGGNPGGQVLRTGHGGHGLLLEVLDHLLQDIKEGVLTDSHITALHSIFQQNLLHALDLLQQGNVTHYLHSYRAAGRDLWRELYVVEGSSGHKYVCFPSSSYCSCPSFVYSVLVRAEACICKHQLATRLAAAMGSAHQVQVSAQEWAQLAASDNTHPL